MISNMIKRFILRATNSGLRRVVSKSAMTRDLIKQATAQNLVLTIEYTDAEGATTVREIEPREWDATNVIALCRERKEFRNFRISRIQSASWTGDIFDPDSNKLIEQGRKERACC